MGTLGHLHHYLQHQNAVHQYPNIQSDVYHSGVLESSAIFLLNIPFYLLIVDLFVSVKHRKEIAVL